MKDVSSPETAERVFAYLSDKADRKRVAASVRDIATDLEVGRQTALNAINLLCRSGHLEIARKGTGNQYPTTYRIIQPNREAQP